MKPGSSEIIYLYYYQFDKRTGTPCEGNQSQTHFKSHLISAGQSFMVVFKYYFSQNQVVCDNHYSCTNSYKIKQMQKLFCLSHKWRNSQPYNLREALYKGLALLIFYWISLFSQITSMETHHVDCRN